jgi:DNA uptake protein ComE-like DNA-binding protein
MKIKKIIEPFLLLSRAERNGSLILLAIIIILLLIRFFLPFFFSTDEKKKFEFESRIAQYEIDKGTKTNDSAVEKFNYQKNTTRGKSSRAFENHERSKDAKELFLFDPNQVSYDELVRLGFSQVAANNLIKYRSKGGRFYLPEDLRKIYGIDSSFYLSISSFISITSGKGFAIVKLELNSADSATMTALKGIGPVLASRICKYRNQLGGFVSAEQLKEVYQLPPETYEYLLDYVEIDSSKVRKININFASVDDLKRHPYCRYKNARKIVDFRSKSGYIQSLESLVADSVIDSKTFKLLSPYLKIE